MPGAITSWSTPAGLDFAHDPSRSDTSAGFVVTSRRRRNRRPIRSRSGPWWQAQFLALIVVAVGGSAAEPTFTPDSAHIVFVAQMEPGGNGVLAAVDLDGSNLKSAIGDEYHQGRHPRFRPAS